MELGRSKINNRILSVILDSIEFLHIDEETERLSVSIIAWSLTIFSLENSCL